MNSWRHHKPWWSFGFGRWVHLSGLDGRHGWQRVTLAGRVAALEAQVEILLADKARAAERAQASRAALRRDQEDKERRMREFTVEFMARQAAEAGRLASRGRA